MPLVKNASGSFELTVPLPTSATIFYKYVVDGEWQVNSAEKIGNDNGIENNVLDSSDFVSASSTQSKIPEAGGLAVGSAAGVGAAAHAKSSDLKTTVLPSSEGQQSTLGEPGIHIPKDPEALAAFETVRDVDPKTLNEPETADVALTAEEKKKQKKKLKRSQYKAKKKLQKAGGVSSNAEDTSGVLPTPTPEPETLDPGVVGAIGAAGLAGAFGAGAVGAAVTAGAGALFADSIAHSSHAADSATHAALGTEPVNAKSEIPGSAAGLLDTDATSKSVSATGASQPAQDSTVTVPVAIPSEAKTSHTSESPAVAAAHAAPEAAQKETAPVAHSVPETAEASKETAAPAVIAGGLGSSADVEPTVKPAIDEPIVNDKLSNDATSKAAVGAVPVSDSVEETAAPVEDEKTSSKAVPAAAAGLAGGALGGAALADADKKHTDAVPSSTPAAAPVQKDVAAPTAAPVEKDTTAPIAAPVENDTVAPTAAPVEKDTTAPVAAAPAAAAAPVAASEATDSAPVAPAGAKEVHASPVQKKTKPAYDSDDEIIIAQGGLSAKEVEAQLAASDINVEEIKPTASEAQRLAKEAHIPEAEQSPVKSTATPATKSSSKPASKTSKKEEKKKGGFLAKLKKLFK